MCETRNEQHSNLFWVQMTGGATGLLREMYHCFSQHLIHRHDESDSNREVSTIQRGTPDVGMSSRALDGVLHGFNHQSGWALAFGLGDSTRRLHIVSRSSVHVACDRATPRPARECNMVEVKRSPKFKNIHC